MSDQKLLSKFWHFEQLFAVLTSYSNFENRLPFCGNVWENYRFTVHIKHEKVNNLVENFRFVY